LKMFALKYRYLAEKSYANIPSKLDLYKIKKTRKLQVQVGHSGKTVAGVQAA